MITAHSGQETMEFLQKFPNVDGIVVHSEMRDVEASELFSSLKTIDPGKPTILLMAGVARSRKYADHTLPSDEPYSLLQLLRQLFGDPRQG